MGAWQEGPGPRLQLLRSVVRPLRAQEPPAPQPLAQGHVPGMPGASAGKPTLGQGVPTLLPKGRPPQQGQGTGRASQAAAPPLPRGRTGPASAAFCFGPGSPAKEGGALGRKWPGARPGARPRPHGGAAASLPALDEEQRTRAGTASRTRFSLRDVRVWPSWPAWRLLLDHPCQLAAC